MADSENSRTLSSRTQRNLLASAADFLSGKTDHGSISDHDAGSSLAKWHVWQEAYHEFCLLCRLQQHLEREMLETVGSPQIEIDVPGEVKPFPVHSDKEIENLLPGPEMAQAREKAKEALATQRSNWNIADKISGYSRALEAESAASDLERASALALWETPARSVEGTIAKLHVLLTLGVLAPDCHEFPWPPLRSVLADLMAIVQADAVTPSSGA